MVHGHELPLQVVVDLGVLPMKRYSIFLKALDLELNHQMQFSVKPRTLVLFAA